MGGVPGLHENHGGVSRVIVVARTSITLPDVQLRNLARTPCTCKTSSFHGKQKKAENKAYVAGNPVRIL